MYGVPGVKIEVAAFLEYCSVADGQFYDAPDLHIEHGKLYLARST